jgi:hypothetical protein
VNNIYALLTALIFSTLSAAAQGFVFKAQVIQQPAQIQWTSRPFYCYTVECSPDLQTWTSDGVMRPGTGNWMASGFSFTGSTHLYLRVREHNTTWLARPMAGETFNKEAGVIFAFNLAAVSPLPDRICISKRPNSAAPWTLIGTITDITTLKGVNTVRGPSLWLPSETGSCQVLAQMKNSDGTLIASAERSISIYANTPPTVAINSYVQGFNPYGEQAMGFPSTVNDADPGDEVRRVEYSDEVDSTTPTHFLGTDYAAPFGNMPQLQLWAQGTSDGILNMEGRHQFYPNKLLKGQHIITARAYDRHGAYSTVSFPHNVTTGNPRPTITVQNWLSDHDVLQQFAIFEADFNTEPELGYPRSIYALSLRLSLPHETVPPYDITWSPFAPTGLLKWDTSAWTPGTSLFTLRGAIGSQGVETYMLHQYVQVDAPAYANATDMAASMLDESTAPMAPGSQPRFMGAYAATQPYSGGTAAGLDALSSPRQMDAGVVFTTGKFADWNGNDNYSDRGWPWLSPGDTTIHDKIDGSLLQDASSIEFNINCIHSQFEMELQFGSEEWDDLLPLSYAPGAEYLDTFVVTLDNTLLSLTPDGASPITMSAIHPGLHVAPACREHLHLRDSVEINSAAGPSTQVEYDGMTVRLRLHAFVTPGIHKLKIAIADRDGTGQGNYDSALFIRQGSIRTIAPTP